ncbi:hypothetical protein EV294_102690 [Paenibacillus sp. BK033]|nr:hypothetical protein EV294_102690 [Paenibacillus sp. BK033]
MSLTIGNKLYRTAVIQHIQSVKEISEIEAIKIFLRYYQHVKRHWGHGPNVEDFAEKIIKLDELVNKLKREQTKDSSLSP